MDIKSITTIRQFNRFYIRVLGILDKQLLNTNHSLIESRILLEIKENEGCIANDLSKHLDIDKSYLSRILNRLEKNNLIRKNTKTSDNRKNTLALTEKGEEAILNIDLQANTQIEEFFDYLPESDIEKIIESMAFIKEKIEKPYKGERQI